MKRSASQRLTSLVGLAVTAVLILAGICFSTVDALAQSAAASGQIVGQVLDSSGAAIAGAEVTVRNKNTNYTRNATTDDAGRYAVPLVPVGPYEVKVTASGFEPGLQEVIVTLGSSVGASFSLGVGQGTDVVEISAGNTEISIEPTRSSAQTVINSAQIQDLPANGRRFQDFLLLTPTVAVEPERSGLTISGQRGINSNINIDGADYNQPFFGGIRGGERSGFAPTVSQEAVQEFQVARNGFSAEFGRSTGGVVNVITKSGTNEFHGSAFYNIRDESLTAEDAIGATALARQQQFGGSFGGPIVKDRTFFFAALDFQQVNQPVNISFRTLDTQRIRNTPGGQAFLGVAPEESYTATNDSEVLLGRIDHQLFTNNNLSARFNYSNNVAENATSTGGGNDPITNRALSNNGIERDRTYTFVSQLTSILSSRFINEFRFQYAREERPRENTGEGPEVTVLNNGATVGIYGRRAFLPIEQFDDRYQITNNFSVVTGAHTAKFGFDFNRVFVDQIFRSDANGVYRFNSLADFLARRPSQFRQFLGSGAFDATQKELAFYAQDEWRVRPGLTISPGFRYEATFNPDLLPATAPMRRAPQATKISDDKRQYAPRLGIAWDVKNNGKNVVRLGGGLFYARTPLLLFNQAITNNGGNPELGRSLFLGSTSAILAAFNAVGIPLATAPLNNLPIFSDQQLTQLLSGPEGALTVAFFDPEFRNPRATQFNAQFDREITRGVIAGISFQYVNTTRLERLRDVNLPAATFDATGRRIFSGARPDRRFSVIRAQESSARSLYRAMTLSLNVRRQRYVFDAYYTLSSNYSDDDNERNFAGIQYDDGLNLANEYNFSRLDQRHQFTANGLVLLPLGIEASSTVRVSSASPFSAQTGTDSNRDGQFTDRPIVNGVVFKRNTFRNFSFSNISLRLQKGFKMPNERGTLKFSIEMFNLLGFDNVQLGAGGSQFGPGTAIVNGRPVTVAPPINFRRLRGDDGNYLPTVNAGAPFQVQVGVRYNF